MNKQGRYKLRGVLMLLFALGNMENGDDVIEKLKAKLDDLTDVLNMEQQHYDNLPEIMMWTTLADSLVDNTNCLKEARKALANIVDAYETSDGTPYAEVKDNIASVIRNVTDVIDNR